MGKSTVGAMMGVLGIPVHESDHAVHALLSEQYGQAYNAINAAFPIYEFRQIYNPKTKAINRKKLGALVFHNAQYRQTLESILHPLVRQRQEAFLREEKAKGCEMACLDIPLLFETNAQDRLDYTITVSAPFVIQKQRVLSRPNMSEDKFHAILERQMPDTQKCKLADYVIKTGLGRAHTMKTLKTTLMDIRQKSE